MFERLLGSQLGNTHLRPKLDQGLGAFFIARVTAVTSTILGMSTFRPERSFIAVMPQEMHHPSFAQDPQEIGHACSSVSREGGTSVDLRQTSLASSGVTRRSGRNFVLKRTVLGGVCDTSSRDRLRAAQLVKTKKNSA